jgi:peptidoglycan/LPS O-acetylase OafA/YrhL
VPERLHLAAFDPWFSYAATLALAVAAMYFVERPARKAILRRKPLQASVPVASSEVQPAA